MIDEKFLSCRIMFFDGLDRVEFDFPAKTLIVILKRRKNEISCMLSDGSIIDLPMWRDVVSSDVKMCSDARILGIFHDGKYMGEFDHLGKYEFHREDGPAIESEDECLQWYLHGRKMTEKEHIKMKKQSKTRTSEEF